MTMPDKLMRLWRHDQDEPRRPVMLAIAGDSAAGKTTLTRGIAETLGPGRATALCVDDYHRYDRVQRRDIPFTVLHPDCNYIEVMEQHLQLLALGRPILKPVYDHATGELVRPVLVEPRDFVIVEGLLPLHTKLTRACFDITVYLDPRPTSGRNGSGPTSRSGSRPSPGSGPGPSAPRCPRRSCSARPSAIPTCATCSPTTTAARCT